MTTALVLGAGGLTGQAFHLGVLSALHDALGFDGREADVLVGTSAGSMVAAGLACGLSAHDMAEELRTGRSARPRRPRQGGAGGEVLAMPAQADPDPRRGPHSPGALLAAARRPWAARPSALAGVLLPAGRQSTGAIDRGVRRLQPSGWPDRDLRVCAVRSRDARRVVLDRASGVDLGPAVAASCAVPAWFAPVRVGGETYVDGGVHSPSNADVVLPDRPDLVVVLSPMSVSRTSGRRRADLPLRLGVRGLLALEVLRLRRAGSRVVVLQPDDGDLEVMGANPMRGGRSAQVVARAAESTRARLRERPDLLGP